MMTQPILIVEDDPAITHFIQMALELQHYPFEHARSGKEAYEKLLTSKPILIILDLGLPDMDGQEIITKTRQWSSIPIIVVSARGEEHDKIQALDAGADDYVTKPFSMDELLARIRVALRRVQHPLHVQEQPTFQNGPLTIHYDANRVFLYEEEIHLTPNEYILLETFSKHVGKVLTHNFLLKSIWQDALETDLPNLRVFMTTLRKKLENPHVKLIQTHIRVGYRMIHVDERSE